METQYITLWAVNCKHNYVPSSPDFIPDGPPLPRLPDQYSTVIEANIVDRNMTTTGREYFDGPGNRATLQMFKDNDLFSLIYDYKNNQLFYVHSCTYGYVSLLSEGFYTYYLL